MAPHVTHVRVILKGKKNGRNGLSAETELPKRLGKNITPTHRTSDHPTHSVRVTVATSTAAKTVRLRVEIVHTLHNRCRGIHRSFFMRSQQVSL